MTRRGTCSVSSGPIKRTRTACPRRIASHALLTCWIECILRVPNIMKRVMRCHDFRSNQGGRRRPYREYGLGARRRVGRKVVPALRVAAKTAANFVAWLADIRDISRAPLRVIDRFGSNAHVLHYVRHSKPQRVANVTSARTAGANSCVRAPARGA